jgi:serine/threonine protein kinase
MDIQLHHLSHSPCFSYRDVKPDNLLLMSDGTVVVSDLGLAVSVEEAHKEGAVRFTSEQHGRRC